MKAGSRKQTERGIFAVTMKSGQVHYEVRLKDANREWFKCRTFARLVDARRYKAQLLRDRERQKYGIDIGAGTLPFQDYWLLWSEECRGNVSEGWKKDQDRYGRDFILPVLGAKALDGIRSRDISLVLGAVKEKGLGEQSQLHVYNVLRKAFGDAIEHFEYLELSPVKRSLRPRIVPTERASLHPHEVPPLLATVVGHWIEPAIMIGVLAGLRPGEIQALRWSAVDLDRATIAIRATYNRKEGRLQPHPKQKKAGTAPIAKPLLEFLGPRRAVDADAFVAPGPQGGMLSYHSFYVTLKRFCERAGVTIVAPHGLRHTATELWVINGASQEDCRRLLNHASIQTTARYMHRTDERLQQLAGKFRLPRPVFNELGPGTIQTLEGIGPKLELVGRKR